MTVATLPFAAALPLVLGGPLPTAAASGLILDGPATVLHHGPTPWSMPSTLDGALCEAPKVCREVYYDWIQPYGPIEIGMAENVRRLNTYIKYVGTDPKIVYGFSGGARVASVWLQDKADDSGAPEPEDLSFVLIGNGGRDYGGVNGWFWGNLLETPTDTQYEIVDIAREYDPIADFPTNPFNLLALANGIAAFSYVHLRYDEVNLDDPDNIVWKEGKTTYVHVPTDHLPLLQGFYDLGLGWMVEDLEPELRVAIDKAYNRTWLEGKEPQGEVSTPTAIQEVSRSAATVSDEDASADGSIGTADATETTGGGSSDELAEDSTETADSTAPVDDDPVPAGEVTPTAEADGDIDDTPSVDDDEAAEDGDDTGTPDDTEADDTGTSDDGGTSDDAEADDAPTGGKHRAPLNGTAKAEKSGDSASRGADAGAGGDGSSSTSSSSSSSGGDSES
ncbi:PE-PPE domain-containing protein [Mycolicibacterium pyrenivorans]|uniref:PE-PPE domain-containing protein n=1 Tax=Mycolicibacterium pyrenivorans TaxID=187102 RepID=UPI0021F38AB0|nr:PE-PPE domain-containing protein [Mycolicibacterium pyrenivorans]